MDNRTIRLSDAIEAVRLVPAGTPCRGAAIIEALSAIPAVEERENLTDWATGVLQDFIRNLENEVYYIEDFPKDVIAKLRTMFDPTRPTGD